MKMKKYGLIGYPLSHSFSPGYFAKRFKEEGISDCRYDLYPLQEISQFKDLGMMSGINVTIPYKEEVIIYLDELSIEAETIGAVNTIKYINGKKIGYNTDAYGFAHTLSPLWAGRKQPDQALVLGTGGAAKAVWYVLDQMGITFKKVSRTKGDITYDKVDKNVIEDHHLIINTTPLGMSPNTDACPNLPYEGITEDHYLYDLVYNPEKTLFLSKGESNGAMIKNGYQMLELQADRSWEIWNS